jgi:hypothetical protein
LNWIACRGKSEGQQGVPPAAEQRGNVDQRRLDQGMMKRSAEGHSAIEPGVPGSLRGSEGGGPLVVPGKGPEDEGGDDLGPEHRHRQPLAAERIDRSSSIAAGEDARQTG